MGMTVDKATLGHERIVKDFKGEGGDHQIIRGRIGGLCQGKGLALCLVSIPISRFLCSIF